MAHLKHSTWRFLSLILTNTPLSDHKFHVWSERSGKREIFCVAISIVSETFPLHVDEFSAIFRTILFSQIV